MTEARGFIHDGLCWDSFRWLNISCSIIPEQEETKMTGARGFIHEGHQRQREMLVLRHRLCVRWSRGHFSQPSNAKSVAQDEHFSWPSTVESVAQDEDELIWAAIGRLPSQKRSNYAIIKRSPSAGNGAPLTEAVDVRKLDQTGRELLLMNATATTEQDNYNLLSGVKERLNRVGLKVPTVEVRFEGLKISANVQIGHRALPTLINFTRDTLESCLTLSRIFRPKRHLLTILNSVSGHVKPGR